MGGNFCGEMIFGLTSTQSVMLSEIACVLNEHIPSTKPKIDFIEI